ncbi:hypothetical protein L7U65_26925, partial [Klebsiella pneumoniae]|nr:hypothetical protein [Klebsiella pneumoniae]
MKQKRARLIYNPTSGQEIMKKNVAEVLDILEGAGFETSAFQTTPDENSAKNEATRAAEAGFDLVIAAGGDGKLSKAQSDQLYETVFEIIDDIANIDLFGVSEGELTNEVSPSDMFEIQYDGHTL